MPHEVNEIINRMRETVVGFGEYGIRFRDREGEVKAFLGRVLAASRVGFIYGPFGAGKSTFLKTLASAMQNTGDVIFVYYDYNVPIVQESMPEVMVYAPVDIKRVVIEALRSIQLASPFVSVNLGEVLKVMLGVLSREGLRDVEGVVFVFDEYDRYLKSKAGDPNFRDLDYVAGALAQAIEHADVRRIIFKELADRRLYFLFPISDQTALRIAMRLGGKGLTMPYLLWNLPRQAFREVVNEVAELTGAKNVNVDLLWNLLGGNVRELEVLVVDYNWDYRRWLQEEVIERKIIRTLEEYERAGRFSSIGKVLESLVDKGRAAAGDYGLGEFMGQPDAVEGDYGFLENNIMINLTGAEHLSELPTEPWIGKRYAYQIPAYYWVLRAMIRKGINVKPEDVLEEINESGGN
ncbi:MAG: KAP family NTPase [Vulcanisaeta sp.]|nr:KAP family NTPase [Vulcanisaeta sp.]MCG2887597.1 KAP family NTPase [Vulcanisaeta sp.]